MKIFNFSFFSDLIFCAFSGFLISLVISSYFLQNPFNLILSICFALLFALFSFKISYNKRYKKLKYDQEKKEQLKLCEKLCFYTKPRLLTLFEKAFSAKGERVEKRSSHLVLPDKNLVLFFVFSFDGVKKADIVKAFNKIKANETAIIYAPDFFEETKQFANRFKNRIVLKNAKSIYDLLKETSLFPQTSCELTTDETKKVSAKNFLKKKNSLKYFMFGVFFLLLSFVVPFKIYYIVVGSLLMIFSLIIKFFIKDSEQESAN